MHYGSEFRLKKIFKTENHETMSSLFAYRCYLYTYLPEAAYIEHI